MAWELTDVDRTGPIENVVTHLAAKNFFCGPHATRSDTLASGKSV